MTSSKIMTSLNTILIVSVILLFEPILARPQPYVNPGQYILRSCTATAQLRRNHRNRTIVNIVPASVIPVGYHGTNGSVLETKVSTKVSDPIKIIKIKTIPYPNREKTDAPRKKIRQKPELESETPLRTIKVNSSHKGVPVVFKALDQLPSVDIAAKKNKETTRNSSPITVIKMT